MYLILLALDCDCGVSFVTLVTRLLVIVCRVFTRPTINVNRQYFDIVWPKNRPNIEGKVAQSKYLAELTSSKHDNSEKEYF